jgi:hypothetical protein
MSESEIKARQAECRGVLEALNAQFCAHICEQKERNLRRSWVEGCQDYVKHVRKLMVSARSLCFVLSFVGESSRFSLSLFLSLAQIYSLTHSLFLKRITRTYLRQSDFKDVFEEEQGEAAKNNDNDDSDDSDDSDDDGQPKTSIFGNLPKPGTAFGIGGGASSLFPPAGGAKTSSNNPFAPSAATTTAFGGSTTTFPKFPAGGALAQQAKEEEDDEEPERPPSPSTAEATGEDDKEFVDMEKQKVKLYVKKEASEPWADRGVNRLQFRREKEGTKGACRILMRTSIGKAVINANLYDNMSVTFAEQKDKKDGSMKKTGVILTIFNACDNSEKQIVLLKLGSQEAVEELHGLIVKNTRK